jgi:hypothetical protein
MKVAVDTSLMPGRLDTRQKSQNHKPLDGKQISVFTIEISKVTYDTADLIKAMGELDPSREKFPE